MSHLCRMIMILMLLIGTELCSAAQPKNQLAAGMVNPGYEEKPAWFKQSFLDMPEDLLEATTAGKRLMLYFYQDGCPYCAKLLRENFAIKTLTDHIKTHFDVVAINIWGALDVVDFAGEDATEKAFARSLKVKFTPTIIFFNEQGKAILRINGYYPPHKFMAALQYVSDKQETKLPFRDYYRQQSPQKAQGKLHNEAWFLQAPFNLSTTERPLLVLFEQASCVPCDELHLDILQRAATRSQLERFNVALLNMWGRDMVITPDGTQTTARAWAQQLDVQYAPSLVFFDQNQEVFRTEAYLKAFHIQSALDYVASGAYHAQPDFQRFLQDRADALRAQGQSVNLMH